MPLNPITKDKEIKRVTQISQPARIMRELVVIFDTVIDLQILLWFVYANLRES